MCNAALSGGGTTHYLKKLLISIQDHPMNEQQQILLNTFNDWRGDIEQVDDALVIGVRY